MIKMKKAKLHCQDCDATGLHTGHLEAKGTATICSTCQGKGYIEAEYQPFTRKKKMRGIFLYIFTFCMYHSVAFLQGQNHFRPYILQHNNLPTACKMFS